MQTPKAQINESLANVLAPFLSWVCLPPIGLHTSGIFTLGGKGESRCSRRTFCHLGQPQWKGAPLPRTKLLGFRAIDPALSHGPSDQSL